MRSCDYWRVVWIDASVSTRATSKKGATRSTLCCRSIRVPHYSFQALVFRIASIQASKDQEVLIKLIVTSNLTPQPAVLDSCLGKTALLLGPTSTFGLAGICLGITFQSDNKFSIFASKATGRVYTNRRFQGAVKSIRVLAKAAGTRWQITGAR